MLNVDVCYKCSLSLGFIASLAPSWWCIPKKRLLNKSTEEIPEECIHLFEHAVAAGRSSNENEREET